VTRAAQGKVEGRNVALASASWTQSVPPVLDVPTSTRSPRLSSRASHPTIATASTARFAPRSSTKEGCAPFTSAHVPPKPIDGLTDGLIDGFSIKPIDGLIDGLIDETYGLIDGLIDETDGLIDGLTDESDGLIDGLIDETNGLIDGLIDETDGLIDGLIDGPADGPSMDGPMDAPSAGFTMFAPSTAEKRKFCPRNSSGFTAPSKSASPQESQEEPVAETTGTLT
jgi:hypothetical protein